jgi:hypothetical protein
MLFSISTGIGLYVARVWIHTSIGLYPPFLMILAYEYGAAIVNKDVTTLWLIVTPWVTGYAAELGGSGAELAGYSDDKIPRE